MQSGSPVDLTQLLFLVRDFREEHSSTIADYDPNSFQEMLADFTAEWMQEHAIASNHYFDGRIQLQPLGNIKSNLQSYLTTVWESVPTILRMVAATSRKTGREILSTVTSLCDVFAERVQAIFQIIQILPVEIGG